MRNLTPLAALLLAGCATTPPADTDIGPCRPDSLGGFVGQVATSELGARMLAASGARVVRWVQPGMAVTMDYRGDRITVRLDSANRVVSGNCG